MTEYGRIHTDGSRSGGQPVIKTQHCPNCEATKQKLHDFQQKVSDAVADAKFMIETHCDEEASTLLNNRLSRFIIPAPKPDPLVEALNGMYFSYAPENAQADADALRAALEARGLEIREKQHDRNTGR